MTNKCRGRESDRFLSLNFSARVQTVDSSDPRRMRPFAYRHDVRSHLIKFVNPCMSCMVSAPDGASGGWELAPARLVSEADGSDDFQYARADVY